MRAIQVHQSGAPEVLQLVEIEEPQAGPGQVVVAVEAAGVAFADTLMRSGKFPVPLPYVPGLDAGGRVIQVGAGGDPSWLDRRVVVRTNNAGGYAERVVVEAENVFFVPAGLSIEQASGIFLSGQTAVGLLRAMQMQPGASLLITAAAGSLGSLLLQLARGAGAGVVIGAAGGKEKLALISRLGADLAIDYSQADWVEQVRAATGGRGADLVLDAVGGTIGRQAFEATASNGGKLAFYGFSSGAWATIEESAADARGVEVSRPISAVMAKPAQELRSYADFALAEAAAGRLLATIRTYPLAQAAAAHAAFDARQIQGKALLIP